jgi:hypothetical protein
MQRLLANLSTLQIVAYPHLAGDATKTVNGGTEASLAALASRSSLTAARTSWCASRVRDAGETREPDALLAVREEGRRGGRGGEAQAAGCWRRIPTN